MSVGSVLLSQLRTLMKDQQQAGVPEWSANALLELRGADGFFLCIPLSHAVAESNDVIIAWYMNLEPIPRDHGFPLRLVAPGLCGCRNMKWLNTIRVIILTDQDEDDDFQHDNTKHLEYSQCTDKRLGPWQSIYYRRSEQVLYSWPVCSFVTDCELFSLATEGKTSAAKPAACNWLIRASGYAYVGNSPTPSKANKEDDLVHNSIRSVSVSIDQGLSWIDARLCEDSSLRIAQQLIERFNLAGESPEALEIQERVVSPNSNFIPAGKWCWKRWEADVPLMSAPHLEAQHTLSSDRIHDGQRLRLTPAASNTDLSLGIAHASTPRQKASDILKVWSRASDVQGKRQPTVEEFQEMSSALNLKDFYGNNVVYEARFEI
eukprot:gnl/TRDRNA2_/TRDRNA2_74690_c0_seq1.p1 gnl/TRDRNA2_/TRDRNA2_74690_c0~~gnl/TRDRNA2_/TRDRNA2_74690_c0_seq1.p1  ORF type:complete len:376 (-),score=35.16 gnl/TRDRNA2_/TRDRNA2_74690_c0_seq1:217-1344(-)